MKKNKSVVDNDNDDDEVVVGLYNHDKEETLDSIKQFSESNFSTEKLFQEAKEQLLSTINNLNSNLTDLKLRESFSKFAEELRNTETMQDFSQRKNQMQNIMGDLSTKVNKLKDEIKLPTLEQISKRIPRISSLFNAKQLTSPKAVNEIYEDLEKVVSYEKVIGEDEMKSIKESGFDPYAKYNGKESIFDLATKNEVLSLMKLIDKSFPRDENTQIIEEVKASLKNGRKIVPIDPDALMNERFIPLVKAFEGKIPGILQSGYTPQVKKDHDEKNSRKRQQ